MNIAPSLKTTQSSVEYILKFSINSLNIAINHMKWQKNESRREKNISNLSHGFALWMRLFQSKLASGIKVATCPPLQQWGRRGMARTGRCGVSNSLCHCFCPAPSGGIFLFHKALQIQCLEMTSCDFRAFSPPFRDRPKDPQKLLESTILMTLSYPSAASHWFSPCSVLLFSLPAAAPDSGIQWTGVARSWAPFLSSLIHMTMLMALGCL